MFDLEVELTWDGEGWSGDYNEADPDDQRLMRFTLLEKVDGYREAVEDCSYCTRLVREDMEANDGHYKRIAEEMLLNQFRHEPREKWKKLGERLSWVSLSDVKLCERQMPRREG